MNSFIVKNIVDNTHHIYYGKKTINEYTTFLIDNNNITDFIIEKKNDGLLHIFKKITHRGFFYNSFSFQTIFIIEKIDLELDPKPVVDEYKKITPPKIDDAFIRELKETLSKRLKNKLD